MKSDMADMKSDMTQMKTNMAEIKEEIGFIKEMSNHSAKNLYSALNLIAFADG